MSTSDWKFLATWCVLTIFSSITGVQSQNGFPNTAVRTKYASWSVVTNYSYITIEPAIGTVQKHPNNPLLVQDQPWEMRLDNSYPNIVKNAKDSNGKYRLWYGGFIACKHCDTSQGSGRVNAWHYANSSDGIVWSKPFLGIFNLSRCSLCSKEAQAAGTFNNILMSGDGMGIFYDSLETNSSRVFKAFGTGCFSPDGMSSGCVSGVGVSSDGLHWTDPTPLHWPAPQRYDCHQNMVRDPEDGGAFVLTTRDGFSDSPGRCIGITRGASDGSFGGWDLSKAPELVESGTNEHQLYSQVTFPYYNIWLGLVAVFDTKDASTIGTVHTKLSWAPSAEGPWNWLDKNGLTGESFIPLGTPSSGQSEESAIGMNPPFDSHIIFSAHLPFAEDNHLRIYYMGGNGPHNGPRNTSLGLATLRLDGFGGLKGTGRVETIQLNISAPELILTCDVLSAQGNVHIGAMGISGLDAASSIALTSNSTDVTVRFQNEENFEKFIGQNVTIEIEMVDAIVYTFGFSFPG